MPSIYTTLAGANFRPSEARARCKELAIGEILSLETDPENEHDSSAVKVIADEHFIGFIPKADNSAIFAALERGEDLICEVVGFESSIKPMLEITLGENFDDD